MGTQKRSMQVSIQTDKAVTIGAQAESLRIQLKQKPKEDKKQS